MKRRGLLVLALLLSACATDSFVPPPVSPALVQRAQNNQVGVEQLAAGRTLFVTRCLECHTLPRVTKYTTDAWPHLVRRMSARAELTATEEQSIIAYLRAASSVSPSTAGGFRRANLKRP